MYVLEATFLLTTVVSTYLSTFEKRMAENEKKCDFVAATKTHVAKFPKNLRFRV